MESTPQHIISMDFRPLQEINTEIVAWLFAEGTPIDKGLPLLGPAANGRAIDTASTMG